ncbi:MAG: ethylbenzene dehydrogenase-related protein [Thaumarchaeota archaeon]|nr:ethylbenzene dehydrogenase-related protein [Nitrososphaerota archaeon]
MTIPYRLGIRFNQAKVLGNTMNHKVLLASVLVMIMLTPSLVTISYAASETDLTAHYRDMKAAIYDKVRGIYGVDYSYDWYTNKFTTDPKGTVDSKTVIVDGKLDEAIWQTIDPVTIDLKPTFPWGGAVSSVSVKAANNGTWIFMAFQWRDSTASLEESARVKRPEGGFFYNATWFYSDNLFIGWWMKDYKPLGDPYFNTHYAGTTMGRVPWKKTDPSGQANLWLFKAYLGDDDQRYWPLTSTTPRTWRWGPNSGQDLVFPYPFLAETMLNSTSNYFIGTGVTHVSGCAFPERVTFPFDVRGNGFWKDGVWTLELARPFEPHLQNQATHATISLESNKVYSIFFGASDGHHGENEDVGSISQWYTINIKPSPSSPSLPIPLLIAGGIAVAIVIVGVAAIQIRRGRHRVASAKTS